MYDNSYARLLFIRQLPSSLSDAILTNIAETNLNLIVTVNIAAVEPSKAIKTVKRQLTSMRSDQIKKNKKASAHGVFIDVTSDDLKRSLEEAEDLLQDLTSKNQKMFLTNLVVMVIAESYNELEANTEKIIAVLNTNRPPQKPEKCRMTQQFCHQTKSVFRRNTVCIARKTDKV